MHELLEGLRLQPGDPVVVPPHGPGRVVGVEPVAGEPRLVLELPDGRRLRLDLEAVLLKLRRLADRAQAERALACLSAPEAPADARPEETGFEARMATVSRGELEPLARLVRLMHALSEPSPGELRFRQEIEAQVLEELGLVLGEAPQALGARLTAALAPRAARAGTGPGAACHLHPRKEATDACAACFRPMCELCATADAARFLCPACARRARRRRWAVGLTLLGALVAGGGGLAAYLAVRYEPAFDYGVHALEIRKQAHQLDQDACNRVKMLRFAERLLELGDHARCADRSRRFLAECGPFDRLRWVTQECEKRRGEYHAALADLDLLVAHHPHDKDFRWWRGEVRAKLRDWPGSLADYRQALGLQPRLRAIPFSAARAARRAGRACEGIFFLEQAAYHHPDLAADPDLLDALEHLYRLPDCRGWAARGRARLAEDEEGGLLPVEVELPDGHRARVLPDPDVGLSLVTPALAARLGLPRPADAPVFLAWDGSEVLEGWLARLAWVQLDDARVEGVEVLVTDLGDWQAEPGGPIDGILGLSFLGRFALAEIEGGLGLGPKIAE
jgi:hypothetical protein